MARIATGLTFLVLVVSVSLQAQEVLTNDSVVKLVKASLGEDLIVNMVNAQPGKYSLGTEDVVALKNEGVSEKIIGAMMQKNSGVQNLGTPEPSPSSVPAEPEFVGVVFRLGSAGELLALERQTPVMKGRVRFMGYGGANNTMELKGGRSSVRIKTGEPMEFVVRGYAPQMDPSTMVQLLALKAGKDKREITTAQIRVFGASTVDPNAGSLPVNAGRYGQASIKVVPASPLAPGEYALRSGSMDLFCFGVDEDSKK